MVKLSAALLDDHLGTIRSDVRHIVYQQISPYEQKAFKGMISDGFPNFLRRITKPTIRWGIPLLCAVVLKEWADGENLKINRKDPKEFENDV